MFVKIKPTAVRLNLLFIALLAGFSAVAQEIGDFQPEAAWDGNPDINGIWQAIGTAHWDLQDHEASAGLPEMGAIGSVPPGLSLIHI